MSSVAGLILSGGLATRMGGQDKALIALEGRALLDRCIDRLDPQVRALAINANRSIDAYKMRGLPVLEDTLPGHLGPLAGVLTGLRWAAPLGCSHVVSVAGDTPFFPEDLVEALLAEADSAHPITMAEGPDGRHPTFAIWPVVLADELETALRSGLRKIIRWTDAMGCRNVSFAGTPFDPFFNVNTPEDLATAARMVHDYDL